MAETRPLGRVRRGLPPGADDGRQNKKEVWSDERKVFRNYKRRKAASYLGL